MTRDESIAFIRRALKAPDEPDCTADEWREMAPARRETIDKFLRIRHAPFARKQAWYRRQIVLHEKPDVTQATRQLRDELERAGFKTRKGSDRRIWLTPSAPGRAERFYVYQYGKGVIRLSVNCGGSLKLNFLPHELGAVARFFPRWIRDPGAIPDLEMDLPGPMQGWASTAAAYVAYFGAVH